MTRQVRVSKQLNPIFQYQNVLAIDTSTQTLAVALIQKGKLIAKASVTGQMRHSDKLLPVCERLMKQAEIRVKQVDLIAIGKGPGSFTGLRVGYAFTKGLAMADDIPVVPFSSMELVAYNAHKSDPLIAVMLDARRERFYFGLYRKKGVLVETLHEPTLLSLDEIAAKLEQHGAVAVTGDALRRFSNEIALRLPKATLYPEKDWNARPVNIARLLAGKSELTHASAMKLVPEYLRLSEAEEKLNEKQVSNCTAQC